MRQTQNNVESYRDWRMVVLAGVLGFAVTLAVMEIIDAYLLSLTSLSIALAAVTGSLSGICLVGSFSAWRVRQKLSEQNMRLDDALNNMIQGLCMFDAQNRLLVWNERYRAMYNIDPLRIWRGCTIRDLLDARIAAGTFPLDPARYDGELRAALKQGKSFRLNIELRDGRIIDVVNRPIEGGGWVATHGDITERKRAEHELVRTRTFLDTIINNVPSNIVVKELPSLRYLLVNQAGEKHFDLPREKMIGKTAAKIFPKGTADLIHQRDLELLKSGRETFTDEHAIVTPDGTNRIVSTTRHPVMGDDGKPQYIISVTGDRRDAGGKDVGGARY